MVPKKKSDRLSKEQTPQIASKKGGWKDETEQGNELHLLLDVEGRLGVLLWKRQ